MAIELGDKRRLADYVELAKFRLSLLVLVVTAVGYCLGAESAIQVMGLFHVVLGTALVAFAANALNQYLERDLDRLMRRTADRPIPSGRMQPVEALAFGIVSAAAGFVYLTILVNFLAGILAVVTLLLYIVVYTPLKRRTSLNTLAGAVPGAIPPMIGWVAARGRLDTTAWILFAILFVWQLPHFFAIAWMYREDYARAGYRMISLVDSNGAAIARQTVFFTVVLLGVSLTPLVIGIAGVAYLVGAVFLGMLLLAVAVRFAADRTLVSARSLLVASIMYLPLLMFLLLVARLA
ncbi:MAG: heme o synthase [Phycisphaerales bacterium]|nr:heme o synthase [Phycisphaerales bacterium]